MTTEAPTPINSAPVKPAWMGAISKDESFGLPKSIALYGEPGTFKSTMAAALVKRPGKPKVLLIDIDQGSESIINDPEVLEAKRQGRLDIVPIDPTAEDAFQRIDYILNDVINNDYGYSWVIIDTLNLAQSVAVEHFLANTFSASGKLDPLAGWASVGKWTDKIARGLHNAPQTTGVFILHERSDVDDMGISKVKPKLAGGMRDSFASVPSVVARLSFEKNTDTDKTELIATLGESELVVSKSRYSSLLEPVMRDFSLLRLYELLDEKLGIKHQEAA